jgi:hypothetical protein
MILMKIGKICLKTGCEGTGGGIDNKALRWGRLTPTDRARDA